jgi:diguanylate cyclase (GGDEF)-like protein
LQQTILDGHPREADVYLRHKDGQRVPVKIRAVAVRNSDGAIIGAAESFDERHGVSALQIHPNAQAVTNHVEDLTGVSDRESTQSYLEACLRDFEEDRAPFSVLTLEVDDLENFRKERGAQAAAKLLHIIAATLSKNLREGDIIGHWSGGRFVAILVNCPAATLAPLVFMLRRLISVAEISWWGDRISATVSIGGAVVRAGDTVDSLLARSEQALLGCIAKGGDGGDVL